MPLLRPAVLFVALVATAATGCHAFGVKAAPDIIDAGCQCREGYFSGVDCTCTEVEAAGVLIRRMHCTDEPSGASVTCLWGGCTPKERAEVLYEGFGMAEKVSVSDSIAIATLIARHRSELPCFGKANTTTAALNPPPAPVAPALEAKAGHLCRSGYYYGYNCTCNDFEAGGAYFSQKHCIQDVNTPQLSVSWMWAGCTPEERDAERLEGSGQAAVGDVLQSNAAAFADLMNRYGDKLPCFGKGI